MQQRAAQAGVMGIGYDSDMQKTAGDGVLTSPIWDWALYYGPQFQAIVDGTWTGEWYWAPEVAALAPFSRGFLKMSGPWLPSTSKRSSTARSRSSTCPMRSCGAMAPSKPTGLVGT